MNTAIVKLRAGVTAATRAKERATTPADRAAFAHVERRLRERMRRFAAGATWETLAAEGDGAAKLVVEYQRQQAGETRIHRRRPRATA